MKRAIPRRVYSVAGGHAMACNLSTNKRPKACAGWLENQLRAGNNTGLQWALIRGLLPVPEVEGPQHESLEDTP